MVEDAAIVTMEDE